MISEMIKKNCGVNVKNFMQMQIDYMKNLKEIGIVTGDKGMDKIMTKNSSKLSPFEVGQITEIYGESGTGKTNFCLQVVLSNILGQDNTAKNSVLYLSISKGLNYPRFENIVKKWKEEGRIDERGEAAIYSNFLTKKFQGEINEFEAYFEDDIINYVKLINHNQSVENHKPVKILVIDTLDFLFKEAESGGNLFINKRSAFLHKTYQQIKKILNMNIFVLLINNTVSNFSKHKKSKTKPSMGDYFTNLIDERYEISKLNNFKLNQYGGSNSLRRLRLVFGTSSKEFELYFEIYEGGIKLAEKN